MQTLTLESALKLFPKVKGEVIYHGDKYLRATLNETEPVYLEARDVKPLPQRQPTPYGVPRIGRIVNDDPMWGESRTYNKKKRLSFILPFVLPGVYFKHYKDFYSVILDEVNSYIKSGYTVDMRLLYAVSDKQKNVNIHEIELENEDVEKIINPQAVRIFLKKVPHELVKYSLHHAIKHVLENGENPGQTNFILRLPNVEGLRINSEFLKTWVGFSNTSLFTIDSILN